MAAENWLHGGAVWAGTSASSSRQPELPSGSGVTPGNMRGPRTTSPLSSLTSMESEQSRSSNGHQSADCHRGTSSTAEAPK
eukprot:SAG11_NODE_124_length_15798_cov_14.675776_13_plen_81_part_00